MYNRQKAYTHICRLQRFAQGVNKMFQAILFILICGSKLFLPWDDYSYPMSDASLQITVVN